MMLLVCPENAGANGVLQGLLAIRENVVETMEMFHAMEV